ncbi:hypothetical protein RFI_32381 [Reticulomyxa filosa]|uniref:Uncharacterized protein n=1 Tax=Reticulomyxa filosa TaxID=46433 RepID=X6LTQ0_RETFI|nr:hypothetical protein RFI_32381 [Reticulomyxa filosa]|eukprot:ETO05014.1 hypothetical protein RFI_32381 [Reticulomyxa filosa]
MDVFIDKNIHYRCAFSIAKIALNLNERQWNKLFEFLMICDLIYNEIEKEQLEDLFKCLINRLSDKKADDNKWNDKQLDITFQCLIDVFQNINGYHCDISCGLLEKIAMQLNEHKLILFSHVR